VKGEILEREWLMGVEGGTAWQNLTVCEENQ